MYVYVCYVCVSERRREREREETEKEVERIRMYRRGPHIDSHSVRSRFSAERVSQDSIVPSLRVRAKRDEDADTMRETEGGKRERDRKKRDNGTLTFEVRHKN